MFNMFRSKKAKRVGDMYSFFKDTVRVDVDRTVRGQTKWVVYVLKNGRFEDIGASDSLEEALKTASEVK